MNQKELDQKLLEIFDFGADCAHYPHLSTKYVKASEKLILQIIEEFAILTAERDALAAMLIKLK